MQRCFRDSIARTMRTTSFGASRSLLVEGKFRAPESVEREVHGVLRTFRPRRTEIPSRKTQREVLLLARSILSGAVEDNFLVANPFPAKLIPSGKPDAATKKKASP